MLPFRKLRLVVVLGAAALLSCRGEGLSATAAALAVNPQEVDFGPAWLGQRSVALVELHNEGRGSLEVSLTTAAPFAVVEAVRLGGGEARQLEVSVTPAAIGALQGVLRVRWSGGEVAVPLSAQVAEVPLCAPRECHAVSFDVATGACVERVLEDGAACGAGNQCLVAATCLAGACVGAARDCDDDDACTADACDPATGCRRDAVACPAALDPCQVPLCDAARGCGLAPAVDGTACGPNDCSTAQVCVAGACVARAAPEGSACAPPSTCRGAGVCRANQCLTPPPALLRPRWEYRAPAGHAVAFSGAVDDDGNAYATEHWLESDTTGNEEDVEVTALVSLSRDGHVRFKEVVATRCPNCKWGLSYAIDQAGRRLFFVAQLKVQARSLDTGRLLWTRDVTAGLQTFDVRPDGGGAFSTSPPLLLGDALVGVPVYEGMSDHHAYVRTFERPTGTAGWTLHKKGHLYGVGADQTGELWLSSANCWAPAGELTRVTAAGTQAATRAFEFYPATGWTTFGVGQAQGKAMRVDAALNLTDLSAFDVRPTYSPLLVGNEVITWESTNGLMATDVTTGAHRFRTHLPTGASPDFQLVRDGGVAWTSAVTDGGMLGAIDAQGREQLSCFLPAEPASPTAIVRGVAYVLQRGVLTAYDVPGLDAETSGWISKQGSPARAGRAR